MGLFTQLLPFNGLARRLPTICKKSSQRTSNSDSRQKKDVLKNIRFSNYFMLAVFISLIMFPKIVFAVWNFVRSLKFYYKIKTISKVRPCMLSKSIESDFSTLNWIAENEKICYVHSREILLNTATIRGKLDWNWPKFYGERNTGLRAITAPNYKQPNKLSQLQNTQLNFSTYSDFPCHSKVNRDD